MSLRFARLLAAVAMLGLAPTGATAAEHVVKMLNDNGKGEFMVFEPSFVEAAPGDTIKFVATDQFHNAETLPEIWPEGAATFKGELSKDVTLTVEKEGVYGIKCSPHYIMGHGGARVGRQAGQCRSGQGLSAARDGGQALGGARGEGPAISRPKPPVVMPANAGIQ